MASVSDIITYVGIPLTLLGIVPIFYTILNSLLTHRNILRLLRSKTPVFATTTTSTSGSLISGIIEVALPRFSIAPLERTEPEYWALNPQVSSLPGGSWTLFNWNYMISATKTYRLQYSDDLQIPQAEVDFGELISFLMDRGAVPDAKGLHMLRVSGLWTPTGTPLLVSPDAMGSVLRVASTQDSDGVLSLALRWEKAWDYREEASLPVGWMRLEVPPISKDQISTLDEKENHGIPLLDAGKSSIKSITTDYTPTPTSLRFRLAPSGNLLTVQSATWEHSHTSLPVSPSQPLLTHLTSPSSVAYPFFPSLALIYALSDSLPIHTCTIPSSITVLTTSSASIPTGVMVVLKLIPEEEAPEWGETKYNPLDDVHAVHSRFMAKHRAMDAERMMAPEQARAAIIARESQERAQMMEDAVARSRRERERSERREREAVASMRLSASVVAERALSYLGQAGRVDVEKGLRGAVERLLVGIVREEQPFTGEICRLLGKWKDWAERGGMTRDDLALVENEIVGFCFAACAIGLMAEVGGKDETGLATDMRECVRVWKKVRLG